MIVDQIIQDNQDLTIKLPEEDKINEEMESSTIDN